MKSSVRTLAMLLCTASCTSPAAEELPQGPTLLWSADAESLDNPFPDGRLLDADGHVKVRANYWMPFLPAAASTPEADALFGGYTDALATLDGWSVSGAFLLRTSQPVDAASLQGTVAWFVPFPAGDPVAAHVTWRADPGFLHVKPARALMPTAEYALVVMRGMTAGGRAVVESADAWRHRRGEGSADLDDIAARAGLQRADILFAQRFRVQDCTSTMLRAVETVSTLSPVASVPSTPMLSPRPRGVFTPDTYVNAFGSMRSLQSADRVAVGTFGSMDLRGEDGAFDDQLVAGTTSGALNDVEFVLVEPDAARFPPPWPTVIAQHGFNGTNRFAMDVAREFNDEGWAIIGIDAVDHGVRGNVFAFFDVRDLRAVRDRFRQTVLDQLQLVRLVAVGGIDVDGVPGPDLDGRVAYFGHSFGAITGTVHASVAPHRPAVAVNAAAGGLLSIMDSPSLRGGIALLVRPLMGLDATSPGYDDALPMLQVVAQPLFDAADPLGYAQVMRQRRSDGGRPRYLVQEDVGDTLVPNVQTQALADALGLADETTARSSSEGLFSRWRLDPLVHGVSASVEPHEAYFHVPAARRQAARFIASDGTELLDVR